MFNAINKTVISPSFLRSVVNLQIRKFKYSATMSNPRRYFINNLQDYDGRNVFKDTDLKSKIFRTVNTIVEKQPPNIRDADGGLYIGIAGIGYMFYHLSQSLDVPSEKSKFLKKGLEYIEASLEYAEHHRNNISAFLLGNSGIYAVAAALYRAHGVPDNTNLSLKYYVEAAANCKPLNFLACGGDELLVGRAGYLSGILWLQKIFGNNFFSEEDTVLLCKCIVESGRKYAQHHKSLCPLMYAYYDVEYLGAAHGLSGILQILLSFPVYLKNDPIAEQDVKASVDYMLSLQTSDGNFPSSSDEVGSRARPQNKELVHWCHGAPGVVYLMAKAYLYWKEDKYLQSCLKCGELVWTKGLLRKGPGTCHGVAGSGYVFLLLHRLTGDPKHLHRAHAFSRFMFTPEFMQGANTPDSPYSLYEGLAGTVCFLADLHSPQQAAFPFFDVF